MSDGKGTLKEERGPTQRTEWRRQTFEHALRGREPEEE